MSRPTARAGRSWAHDRTDRPASSASALIGRWSPRSPGTPCDDAVGRTGGTIIVAGRDGIGEGFGVARDCRARSFLRPHTSSTARNFHLTLFAQLTPAIQDTLSALRFSTFQQNPDGFVATRSEEKAKLPRE